jgi:hypothetical protein
LSDITKGSYEREREKECVNVKALIGGARRTAIGSDCDGIPAKNFSKSLRNPSMSFPVFTWNVHEERARDVCFLRM